MLDFIVFNVKSGFGAPFAMPTVTGSGATMPDAQAQVYSRLKNIILPNMFYRTDIGNRWSKDGDLLHSWGLLAA